MKSQRDITHAAVDGPIVHATIAIAIDIHRAADVGVRQLAKEIVDGTRTRTEADGADDRARGRGPACAACGVLAVEKYACRRRNGTLSERVARSIRRQQITEGEAAVVGRDRAALHGIAGGIDARQCQRYIIDRCFTGVATAVVIVGHDARARVLVDKTRQRRGALAEMIIGRPGRRQVGDRDRVGAWAACRVARIDAAIAVTRRLRLAHGIGAAGCRVCERVTAA